MEPSMRTLAFIFLLALFTAPSAWAQHDHGGASGHAAAVQTTPADGAMGAPPSSFSATFEHPMRLTNLVITARGGDPQPVAIPQAAAATTVTVALPRLSPGNYTFTWTAIGADNHPMNGRVRYMVH
jgi:hypothetical protein